MLNHIPLPLSVIPSSDRGLLLRGEMSSEAESVKLIVKQASPSLPVPSPRERRRRRYALEMMISIRLAANEWESRSSQDRKEEEGVLPRYPSLVSVRFREWKLQPRMRE